MKVRLTFTLDVEVKTNDPDEAEQLAKVKADAVIIQTMEATGYRMKYVNQSQKPDVEIYYNKSISN